MRFVIIIILTFSIFQANIKPVQSEKQLIPFTLPWDDSTEVFFSRNQLFSEPAGQHGFIYTQNGHFYAGNGQRFKILGVNTCFAGNFPTHEQSEKIAARMAKYGINSVRFHHMDTLRAPSGIWQEGPSAKQELDPENLDRLDYFISELKKNGIYSNLNLKVAREFIEADGFPLADKLPNHSKGPDYYVDRMITLQKNYAHDLLTHINPYTGNAYINEPAIAIVEINNENGLLFSWRNGVIDDLPEIYLEPLQKQWNLYLLHQYKSTDALNIAWRPSTLSTEQNAIITPYQDHMRLSLIDNAKAQIQQNDEVIEISIDQPGNQDWHIQWMVPTKPIQKNRLYKGTITLKANSERSVQFGLRKDDSPWNFLDQSQSFVLTNEWQTYSFMFLPEKDAPIARLDLSNLGESGQKIWIKDLELQQSNFAGLPDGESLEKKNISIISRDDYPSRSYRVKKDWIDFLIKQEIAYNQEMYDYIRNDLKSQSLITGTQLMFGTIPSQLGHDFIDHHGYFHHPRFPGRAWDQSNWFVENISIVEEEDNVLTQLMRSRIDGYPYTVSEYNHPAPNPYSSEAIPMIAAYGALQDWDGIYIFSYSHSNNYDEKSINNFFDIAGHTPKMMTFPAAANMFLRGDLSSAHTTITGNITYEEYLDHLTLSSGNPWWRPFDDLGISKSVPYIHKTGLKFGSTQQSNVPEIQSDQKSHVSDTKELIWVTDPDAPSHVTIKSKQTKGYIGFTNNDTVDLGDDLKLTIGETINNWVNVLISQMDQSGKHWLITATGYTENKGMIWKNEEKTTVGRDWGSGPPMLESVPFTLTLDNHIDEIQLFALDETGARQQNLSDHITLQNNSTVINLMNNNLYLWYELVIP